MKIRSLLAVVAALALGSFVLVGCGGSDGNGGDDGATAQSGDDAPSQPKPAPGSGVSAASGGGAETTDD